MKTLQAATLLFGAVLLSSCASWFRPAADSRLADAQFMAQMGPELPEGQMGERLAGCYDAFAQLEKQRQAAGAHYRGYFQVPGFPFIRTDRLHASYADEVSGLDQVGRWLESMREYAHFSRSVELSELNMVGVERSRMLHDLSFCSVWLSLLTADQKEPMQRMLSAIKASVPEPIPALADAEAEVTTPQDTDLRLWKSRPSAKAAEEQSTLAHFAACELDSLGRVGLVNDEWERLAAIHAPDVLSVAPLTSPVLAEDEATVLNNGESRLHYHATFARIGDQALLQFSYYIWLPTDADPNSGFKGLIWRVTLDHRGKPLIYDSINLAGQHHQWFAAQPITPRDGTAIREELQGASGVVLTIAKNGLLVRAAARGSDSAPDAPTPATVERYDDLSETPISEDGQRNLFDGRGRLRTKGSPVFMIGQHPAINAQGHAFDDPYLIDKYFELKPGRLKREAPSECGFQVEIAFAQHGND